ncbi:MAG: leucine-rich repeat protein [Treponema sp.]|jgi:uncharacterized repeat protein (TIGR02543 family)|nr:leucine-rich repeat protein [Treponema sp.]
MKKILSFAIVLFLAFLFAGCPDFGMYSIYYDGNQQDEGYTPDDPNTYYSGDRAVVLGPGTLKKQGYTFQGWRISGRTSIYQENDWITIEEHDIIFYAQWIQQDNYSSFLYTTEEDGLTIIGALNVAPWGDMLEIPSGIEGKPVIRIGDDAFRSLYIKDLRLPQGLISIGNNAFSQNWLSQIMIPNTVTRIGSIAFQNNDLQSITLSSALTSIGDYAFDGNYITELDLPPKLTTIGPGAFNNNPITRIIIGSNVTITNDRSLGRYGASFLRYYHNKGEKAGAYVYFEKDDSWKEVLD